MLYEGPPPQESDLLKPHIFSKHLVKHNLHIHSEKCKMYEKTPDHFQNRK